MEFGVNTIRKSAALRVTCGVAERRLRMCPACLATLAMMVAGTASTGGVAAVLMRKFRAKIGAKRIVGVGKSEWTQTKEKES